MCKQDPKKSTGSLEGFFDIDVARDHFAARRLEIAREAADFGAAPLQKRVHRSDVTHEGRFNFLQFVFDPFKSIFYKICHEILHRLVGPADGGGHPAQAQEQSKPAPGGSSKPEGASDA